MTVNSLVLESVKNFSENIANYYIGLPIAEKIGPKYGIPLGVSL